MTASELKQLVLASHPSCHFFDAESMKFFGDSMRNYGVRGPTEIRTVRGDTVSAYELYRRRPVKHGMQSSAFFDAETFHQRYTPTN